MSGTQKLLATIAVLLAVNIVVMLFRPAPGIQFVPTVQANGVATSNTGLVFTTNDDGSVLNVWYESSRGKPETYSSVRFEGR